MADTHSAIECVVYEGMTAACCADDAWSEVALFMTKIEELGFVIVNKVALDRANAAYVLQRIRGGRTTEVPI